MELRNSGHFVVISQFGSRYKLTCNRAHNIWRGRDNFCLVSKDRLPLADELLMQKLMLETDEARFIATAAYVPAFLLDMFKIVSFSFSVAMLLLVGFVLYNALGFHFISDARAFAAELLTYVYEWTTVRAWMQ